MVKRKMMLLITFFIFVIFVGMVNVSTVMADEEGEIRVTYHDKYINTDVPPRIIEGRILVPVRNIVEAIGPKVIWDDETKTVTILNGYDVIKLEIDGKILKNQKEINTDVPAQVINGRIMVPVRFIAEAFGYTATWNEQTRTVSINCICQLSEFPIVPGYKEYKNKAGSATWSIQYPENWTPVERDYLGVPVYNFVAPADEGDEDLYPDFVNVRFVFVEKEVAEKASDPEEFITYQKEMVAGLFSNAKIETAKLVSENNAGTKYYEFTLTNHIGKASLKCISRIVVLGDFFITYELIAEEKNYEKYLEVFKTMDENFIFGRKS